MAGTKRIPIARRRQPPPPPEATRLREKMRALRCTCPPASPLSCAGCRRWYALHDRLIDVLQTPPHVWPVTEPIRRVRQRSNGVAAALRL